MYVFTDSCVHKRYLISLPLRPALLGTVAPPQSLATRWSASFPEECPGSSTEAAMWNTTDMWLDIRRPRCSVDNPSPTLAISPSTYVTFMSLSFGTDANYCTVLNYFELSLSHGTVQNINTTTAKQNI